MRIIIRIFTIVLQAIFVLFFWTGATAWAQAVSGINAVKTESARNMVLAQKSPVPGTPASGETQDPTRTPRPTPTPMPLPPPSNPNTIQLMVIFGILVVLVVVFGLWLNRNSVF